MIATDTPPVRLASAVFLALLFLVFVGVEPFTTQTYERFLRVSNGEGDTVRQLAYAGAFLVTLGLSIRRADSLAALPLFVVLTLGWCLLTSLWSLSPPLSLRRAGLTAMNTTTLLLCLHMIGGTRALRLMSWLLGAVMVVDLIAGLTVPGATHAIGDFGAPADLAGSWRGLHAEKNVAAMCAVAGAMLFLFRFLEERRLGFLLLLMVSIIFLVGTRSKTSISLFFLAAATMVSYRQAARSIASWAGFRRMAFFGLLALVPIVIFQFQTLLDIFTDPTTFTNRGYIWQVVYSAWPQSPLGGFGYRAFWQVQGSPVWALASANWVRTISHAHNGYFELLIGTGAIGLALAFVAGVLLPLRQLLRASGPALPLAFGWMVYGILLNLTEVELFERDRPGWFIVLLSIGLLHQHYLAHRVKGGAAVETRPSSPAPAHP